MVDDLQSYTKNTKKYKGNDHVVIFQVQSCVVFEGGSSSQMLPSPHTFIKGGMLQSQNRAHLADICLKKYLAGSISEVKILFPLI